MLTMWVEHARNACARAVGSGERPPSRLRRLLVPTGRDFGKAGEAEKAMVRLGQGIAKSKDLVREYRARLAVLRKSSGAVAPERPPISGRG